ncbi:MAG: dephospho-CoA kinase [Thermoanaerobaculia bacterium]
MSPYRVGLTGGLAAGKSTVAGWLGEAGFRVIDADRLVAELYRPGGEGARAVSELFGAEFLADDGSVDHPRLAREVFAEPAARRRLEEAIHPLVKQRFDKLTRDSDGVAVLEATLLVEAGFTPDFDLVVTVEADPELRLQRAVARGLEPAAARRRLEAQSEPALRIAAAHRVLWNNGSLDELRSEVDELVTELRGHDGDD